MGKKTAADLAERFGTLEAVRAADRETLTAMDDVGETVAESIVSYFADEENAAEIDELLRRGVTVEEAEAKAEGVFSGESVVLTGSLVSFTRSQAEELVRSLGGDVKSSVTKTTTLVVAGEKAGSKLDKARALGIKIIGEEEFKSLVNG